MSRHPRVIAIIQARMSSTRMPGKVLLDLLPGVSVVEYMLRRVSASTEVDTSIVATTDNPRDAVLVENMKAIGQSFFVGSEGDVLDRYYNAAKKYGAKAGDMIVRLTSDCPVIDPKEIDATVRFYRQHDFDYASNNLEPYSFPDGMDTEVFSFEALEKAWNDATSQSHREHVTFYFWKNPQIFKIGQYVNPKRNQDEYRLTLDYPSDYVLLKKVAEYFSPRMDYSMQEIIDFLDSHLDVKALNADVARNVHFKTA
ncbi:MAG: putative polysaccharide biosynthesis cytidylyltransferase [Parcubacteria group bacterium Gr01-1014_8]|nr:MAG: putative polysaccharide biosynthesis cytidylyltransferase [Parcubacteria group bacterium Gr01-1014_8]